MQNWICPALGTLCSHVHGNKKTSRKQYTPEFRQKMVELRRAGRGLSELSREFGVTSWSIRQWVKQAERNTKAHDTELSVSEREELTRLRRENRRFKEDWELLSRATALMLTKRVSPDRSRASRDPSGATVDDEGI